MSVCVSVCPSVRPGAGRCRSLGAEAVAPGSCPWRSAAAAVHIKLVFSWPRSSAERLVPDLSSPGTSQSLFGTSAAPSLFQTTTNRIFFSLHVGSFNLTVAFFILHIIDQHLLEGVSFSQKKKIVFQFLLFHLKTSLPSPI